MVCGVCRTRAAVNGDFRRVPVRLAGLATRVKVASLASGEPLAMWLESSHASVKNLRAAWRSDEKDR
jgi:hypothetical protein